jgi:hypothetical protein
MIASPIRLITFTEIRIVPVSINPARLIKQRLD